MCVPNLLVIWQSCVGAWAGSLLSVVTHKYTHSHTHTTAPSRLPFCPTHIIFPSWPFKSTPLNLLALSHTTCVINMFWGRFVKPLVHQFMLWLHAYSLCIREIKRRPQMPLTCIKVCINFKLVYLLLVIVKKKKSIVPKDMMQLMQS